MRTTDEFSAPRFPIRIAARRAGVSVASLRAWERRYGAISPVRTAGEQRLYSEDDVERLALLRQLTAAGHSISAIAGVGSDELRRLVSTFGGEADTLPPHGASPAADAASDASGAQAVVEACMRAAHAHDAEAVHRLLQREAFRLTTLGFLDRIATPFMRRIGDDWADGRVSR